MMAAFATPAVDSLDRCGCLTGMAMMCTALI